MNSIFEKNLISTKDAGKLSGYTSDYLSSLARSGKIVGKRIGHSWFIEQESLSNFLSNQSDRKINYARALARAREEEYRASNSAVSNITRTLTKKIQVPEKLTRTTGAFVSHAVALSLALAVVVSGALLARAEAMPSIANRVAEIAGETVSEFNATFGDIPSRIAKKISSAKIVVNEISERNSPNQKTFTEISYFVIPDFALAPIRIYLPEKTFYVARVETKIAKPIATLEGLQASVLDAYEFVKNPLLRVHVAIGNEIYSSIASLFSAYHSLIKISGAKVLSSAASARDMLSDTSQNATMFIGGIGDSLARLTARVPSLTTSAFLRTTEMPSIAASKITGAVFNEEYATSSHFEVRSREILAAVEPALTSAERVALTTYEAVRNFFGSANRAFTNFFAPSPTAAVPPVVVDEAEQSAQPAVAPPPVARPPTVVVSPPSLQPQVSNSYTTVIQGVSPDFMEKSLASFRTDVLATVAGMIKPVASQAATNITTIQQIGKIEDLTDLIVRNGDFRGGTMTSGVSVSATGGTFTTLTGGTTSLGATTVTGDLSLTGSTTLQNFTFANATGTSATTTSFFATTASSTNLFTSNFSIANLSGFLKATAGSVATALIDLASDVTGILPVANGGTGWASIASGSLTYGNGTSALATTTAGTPGYVLALNGTTPTWVATTTFSSGLAYANGNVTNTGVLSLGPTGSALTGALVVATSSTAFNGLTASTTVTGSGTTLTFANTLAGTLGIGGGGTGFSSVGDGQLLFGSGGTTALTALATTSNAGRFLSLDYTTGRPSWVATSSLGTAISDTTGTLAIARGGTGLSSITGNRMLYSNSAGTALLEVATSSLSIGGNAGTATTLLTARDINGVSFNGSANITVTAASSTLLGDTNSWTGSNAFTNAPTLGSLSGLLQGASGAVTAVTGTAGQFPYYNGTNTLTATSSIYLATTQYVGIGTTTPLSMLSIAGSASIGADYNIAAPINGLIVQGNLGVGTTTPWLALSVTNTSASGQFVASYDSGNYATLAVDAVGDLKFTAKGVDIRALSENFWVCDNAGCPTLTATSTAGNIFIENAITFGNGFSMASTSNVAASELGLYNASGQIIIIFDNEP